MGNFPPEEARETCFSHLLLMSPYLDLNWHKIVFCYYKISVVNRECGMGEGVFLKLNIWLRTSSQQITKKIEKEKG